MSDDKERFETLCEKYGEGYYTRDSIGTYKEKRLHVILKRLVTNRPECYEVKVGKYVADVFCDGHITEIQTGSLYPLRDKLDYYLNKTDFSVTVLHPVIASKRIIRIDKETGEILRCRRSPKRIKSGEIAQELLRISEFVKNDRLDIVIMYISADEYRYSDEAVRHRKSGKYDSELFPRELLREEAYCGAESYRYLLEGCPSVFTAKEYGAIKGMAGRPLYGTLNLLRAVGLLSRRKRDARVYEYLVKM